MCAANQKLTALLVCPNCKKSVDYAPDQINCQNCDNSYPVLNKAPVLIKRDSTVLEWYEPEKKSMPTKSHTANTKLLNLYSFLKPSGRVWTLKSQNLIKDILRDNDPDAPNSKVVLIGGGVEKVYKRLLNPYKSIIRIGLSQGGDVDLFCDICDIPLDDNSVDLILSSSVLEHVYNPEQAVKEMFRVLKPGGSVYAEIPFMRSFHMRPVDYQRYTISGIQELFSRHGFTLIDKGICSGPFTGLTLFIIDFFGSMFSFSSYLRGCIVLFLTIMLQPAKYMDRFFENAKWAEVTACNFFYLGRK